MSAVPFMSCSTDTVVDMYSVGEQPGKGSYCCTNCRWSVVLDDDSDRLPPCGNCGRGQNTTYINC
jgi:ribosomal protein S27AE